jgi:High potential iron-sulfur protein
MTAAASRQARRRFLKLATAGLAATPVCAGFCAAQLARLARAQERVAEDEELAQQLGYKHDASEVDPNEWPDYEEGETCANCQLYHGEEGAEWGPCDIFGGRLVNANGWCVSWLEKEA